MNNILKIIIKNAVVVFIAAGLVYSFTTIFDQDKLDNIEPQLMLAPNFTLPASDGNLYSLEDFKGKIIVLEWKNHQCPFVKKHYVSKHMQTLQQQYTNQGIIWFSIISSAKGKQGYVTKEECNNVIKTEQSHATAVLIDEEGVVGKKYKAKTTPHMFVINALGYIVYQGAIDDKPSTNSADISDSKNYISAAINELLNNKPVTIASTAPYGCSIKY